MVLRIFISLVTHKSLSSRLSTADTPTFQWNLLTSTLTGTLADGSKVTATINCNGDLIHKMYVAFNPSALGIGGGVGVRLGADVGNTLLKEVELEIGGQRVDRHHGHWLTVWTQLTEVNPTGAQAGCDANGAEPAGATLEQLNSYNHKGRDSSTVAQGPTMAHVPLQFWFNRNPGLALPLIALQYHY